MISGEFGERGELFFEIELIATNGEIFPIEVLFDTGFTVGWLAIHSQDIEALEWPLVKRRQILKTARGEEFFDLYAGTVFFDGEEFTIPVLAGDEIPENILGLQWLQTRKLIVDFPAGVLTLGG